MESAKFVDVKYNSSTIIIDKGRVSTSGKALVCERKLSAFRFKRKRNEDSAGYSIGDIKGSPTNILREEVMSSEGHHIMFKSDDEEDRCVKRANTDSLSTFETTTSTEQAGILFTAALLADHHGHPDSDFLTKMTGTIPLGINDVNVATFEASLRDEMTEGVEDHAEAGLGPIRKMSESSNNGSMRRIRSLPLFHSFSSDDSDGENEEVPSVVSTQCSSNVQAEQGQMMKNHCQFVDPPEYNPTNFPDTMSPHEFVKVALQKHGVDAVFRSALELNEGFFLDPTDEHFAAYEKCVLESVHNHDLDALRRMHAEGKNLQCCNRFGESLIHMVCRRGFVDMATFLIHEAGVSLRVRDDCGRTPLHDACWASTPAYELVELLITEDPDLLLIADKRGHAPFEYARREHWHYWHRFLYDRWYLMCPRPGRSTIMPMLPS